MEFTSLKRDHAVPIRIRHDDVSRPALASSMYGDKKSRRSRVSRASNAKISFKWSASMVEKVRSSRRRFTDSWVGRVVCCLPRQSRDTKMISRQIDDLPQYR